MGAWIEISLYSNLSSKAIWSHPLWVRGLKLILYLYHLKSYFVAPFMGAWIEICWLLKLVQSNFCRTLYGCVDWNKTLFAAIDAKTSRTLYGCVDWNSRVYKVCQIWWHVAPFMGAWIEIPAAMLSKSKEIKVAPFMGAWIEISIKKLRRVEQNESHPLWVRGLKFP